MGKKWMIATITILFTLLTIGVDTVSAQGKFSDVPNGSWGHSEIHYLKDKGIVNGKGNGLFGPNDKLTRAQAATIIVNAIGKGTMKINQNSSTYPDVRTNFWAYSSIERATQLGIFQGGQNGLFHPNDYISRAQMATIIARTFKLTGGSVSRFSDVGNQFWNTADIAALEMNGIVELGDRFRPNEYGSRAEFTTYLARALEPQFRVSNDGTVLFKGTVNVATTLNVRSAPNTNSSIIGTLVKGETVDVYGMDGEWLRIKYNGNAGYVHQSYIKQVKEPIKSPTPPTPIEKVIAQGKVTSATLNVRRGPSVNTEKIGQLSEGTIVEIYTYENDWAKIKYNGEFAYVSKNYLTSSAGSNSLKDLKIVVDPGHGGKDPGTAGNGLHEKDITLGVSLELERLLKDAGAKPMMTRRDDQFIELNDRAKFANDAQADLFISIHVNSSTATSANGTETWWNSTHASKESEALAKSINHRLVQELGMTDRGGKAGNFLVIRATKMTGVLVELGFLTNSNDAQKMKAADYNQKVAKSILKGIEDYYHL
ncbi:N-acetylmuramoyl-L-alanine amidase [Halalkalibacter nanhaiisediminis]|uniref:N-acetylmuramoyl-L-alanine amidase n=1 Tax=Halalkalibacter nanhaiisediminis TaxID=688079 RepID=A0A562QMF9_9BACI|nr:N-acetylmuramoyl-L-alanine amidase [Halalkalibacter nanhaiisediminis]TWI57924.1 N-acetylmuramoyl-L-alanine amidase [Halalkalibacter nanhaiisediminis]